MKRLTEILKQHVWCVIIIAAIILLSLITLSFCEDVNLVSHLSLGSAIVSIVLAIIVIVYMYFQDQRSSQNITEMRNMIDQGTRMMTDKAGIMVSKAESLEERLGIMQASQADDKSTTPPLEIKESLQLDFSMIGYWSILALYSLAKSHESGKTMSWSNLSNMFYEKDELMAAKLKYAGLSALQVIGSFLGRKAAAFSLEQQEIKYLPEGFKESVTLEVEDRLKRFEGESKFYTEFKQQRDIIDEYFDNL